MVTMGKRNGRLFLFAEDLVIVKFDFIRLGAGIKSEKQKTKTYDKESNNDFLTMGYVIPHYGSSIKMILRYPEAPSAF
jgi:hypothetical protein